MKKINYFLAISALLLCAGSSFALQGRGQSRASAPSPGVAGSVNHDNAGLNPKASDPQPNSTHAADPRDTRGFENYGQYVAAQHVSENLGISLEELRAKMTGPHAESLGKAIQEITGLPAAAANAEAKKAEKAAKSQGKKN